MPGKAKYYLKKTTTVLDLAIKIYIIVAIGILLYDYYSHPGMYNIVSERPAKQNINDSIPSLGTYNNNQIIPEYMYTASTMEECKPLVSLYKFYNRWLKPLLLLIVINSILALISRINFDKVENFFNRIDDEEAHNKKENIQAKQEEKMQ